MDPLRSDLGRTLAITAASGIAVGGIFAARGGLSDLAISVTISTMYALSIGVPSMFAFRVLRPRLAGKPELAQWLLYFAVLVAISAAGTFVTGLAVVGIGWNTLDNFWATYLVGFKIALAITVPCTIGAATYARLHRRIAETERHAMEARLASLESRVRPHFLFNALNSAIALIPEDPPRAEKVLERIAGLLRFSLDARGSVPLGEELRVVADYLEIERVRFGDRLRYELDAPAELADVRVPAFAVQTLVENSVKYAVSPRKAGAAIRVRARRDGERLAIDVTDDGPGFAGDVWLPGHGLDGLRARLHALYGAGARLIAPANGSPGAAAGEGAAVTIELPAEAT